MGLVRLQHIMLVSVRVVKVKVKVTSYIAQYSVRQDRSKHFTLYFPGRPVQSNTTSAYLGSIQPYATINA